MELQTLTSRITYVRWSLSWVVSFWRYVTSIPASRQPARVRFALDNERTAQDIGLSTIKIRFGDLARETGIDAELSSR